MRRSPAVVSRSTTLWAPVRVAIVTTAIVAVIYMVIASAALYLYVTTRYAQVDAQLNDGVQSVRRASVAGSPVAPIHVGVIAWYTTPGDSVRTAGGVPQDVSPPSVTTGEARQRP